MTTEPKVLATKGRWDVVVSQPGASQVDLKPNVDAVEHILGEDCICGPSKRLTQAAGGYDRWIYSHHALDIKKKPSVT